MKTPGPDHPITLTPATRRWRAMYSGHVIADSNDALAKRVAAAPPRQRVPVDILVQNTSPWPLGSVSCYLVDARKGFDGYQCILNQLSPRLLPGEQRKITFEMLPPETRTPNAIGYFLSKSLTITKLEPRFTLDASLE